MLRRFFLILALSARVFGQELDEDCRAITLPTQCRQIAADIAVIEAAYEDRIRSLQQRLARASTRGKATIIRRITELQRQQSQDRNLSRLRNELQMCRQQFDTTPRRQVAASPLNASFAGTVTTNTTDPQARGPFTQNLNLNLQFSRNRCSLTITNFPPISFLTPSTPIGRITVTITKTDGGVGPVYPVSGQITMPLTLYFAYDTIWAGNDTASTILTTESSVSERRTFNLSGVRLTTTNGAPLDACGTIVGGTNIQCPLTIVGTTVFQDGFLGGAEGSFMAQGTIIVVPPPPPPPPPSPGRQRCLRACDDLYQRCMDRRMNGRPTPAQCASGRRQCRSRCPA